jgi:hypothetical protein
MEGAKGGKKRHKQHHQETTITTNGNGGISKQVGSSGVVRVTTATGSSKHQARPPTDHIEKLLKETCPNHTYPVKHKLRDCSIMKSFMTSGSLPEAWKLMRSPMRATQHPFPEKTRS